MDHNQTGEGEEVLTPDEYKVLQQGVTQDNERALQEGTPNTNKAVQESMLPRYPNWPTSKPGPMATPPPPGQRPINAQRSDQMVEVGYNQETGVPSTESPLRTMPDPSMKGRTGFDQLETAPPSSKKRKERL